MKDLIKALMILSRYANDDRCPTNCSHDEFLVFAGIDSSKVSKEDIKTLDNLGFIPNDDLGGFVSFRFGSC